MEKVTAVKERICVHSTYSLCLHEGWGKKTRIIIFITSLLSFLSLHLAQPAAQPDQPFLFLNLFFFFSIKPRSRAGGVCVCESLKP